MREVAKPPHALADEHTLVAQRYAGYFVGHPYRNSQQTRTVEIDRRRRWKEPAIVADDCLFCARLTDEVAERRVAGYQYQIDIESTRMKRQYFTEWIDTGSSDVPEPGIYESSKVNLRRFCELFQDVAREDRPDGWVTRPLPFIMLPLRLKRKLCIEWNHLYLPWMEENGLEYDFEKREFWHEIEFGRLIVGDDDDYSYSDFDGYY